MPPSTSEPEKYSLEEMMERLKGRPAEDPSQGELVTRADGTQAVRVRKRKRRTEQPKREEAKRLKRLRAIQIGSVLVSLIVLTLIVGGAFVYTNTAPYRKRLSEVISQHLGANIEFKMFRVTPVSANAEAVTLDWRDGGYLKGVSFRGLTSKISPTSLFGRSLTGKEIFAREGTVSLQAPQAATAATAAGSGKAFPVSFERVVVTKLDVVFGDPAAADFRISGTEGTLSSDPTKASRSLNLHRGNLAIQGWPALKIDRALVEIRPTEADVIGLRIIDSLSPAGDLYLAGSINTHAPKTRSTLSLKLHTFNLADLLGPEIGKLLSMRIETRDIASSNYLALTADAPADAELAIAFSNSLSASAHLSNLRFLALLAQLMEDKYYDQPIFDDATGSIRRSGGRIEFGDLHLERKTLICIKGDISVAADKALSGTLEVGIPESVINLSSNTSSNTKLEAMFSPVSNNFRWVTVQLGGTLDLPSDDFARKYEASSPETSLPEPGSAGDSAPPAPEADPAKPTDPGKAFDDLTSPP